MTHILLADDDKELCALVRRYLEQHDFKVTTVHNGQDAIDQLDQEHSYDLLLLDVMMPGLNGLDVLRSTRNTSDIPTVMLTGRNTDVDRIIGLDMGADDYIGKPCTPRELLSHINAVLRRYQPRSAEEPEQRCLSIGPLKIDPVLRKAEVSGEELEFTGTEFNTLLTLAESQGQVVTKAELSQKVLYRRLAPYDRSVDVHVSRVRKKLKPFFQGSDEIIKSIRGQGYILVVQ